jgi:cadmium resistance protein CadD (predicted permease)
MDQLLSTLAFATAAFASTNIDDLFLLSSLFIDAEFQTLSCLFGYHLTNHRTWREKLKRYGRFVTPFILIAIGLNVLREQYYVAFCRV